MLFLGMPLLDTLKRRSERKWKTCKLVSFKTPAKFFTFSYLYIFCLDLNVGEFICCIPKLTMP